jgi:hypothetical protein
VADDEAIFGDVIAELGEVRITHAEDDAVHVWAYGECLRFTFDEVRWLAMIGAPEAWRAVRPERELVREEGADAGGGPAPAARHPTDAPDEQPDLFTGAQEG